MDDVLVIGGSFAGLTAAMHLVRARRRVTILDTDLPRNRFAESAHNVVGFDGTPPYEIRARGLANVLAYPTARHVLAEATKIEGEIDGFRVTTAAGEAFEARRLILAYGVTDQMPDLPGFAESWGKGVFHCPYCHGYEVAGEHLAVLYTTPGSVHGARLLQDWASDVTLLTNGNEIPAVELAALAAHDIRVREGLVSAVLHDNGRVRGVAFAGGGSLDLGGVLAHPSFVPAARLHEDIGAELSDTPMGPHLKVSGDVFETTVPGVFAAGDLARMPHSINTAYQGGMMAAIGCHRSLLGLS